MTQVCKGMLAILMEPTYPASTILLVSHALVQLIAVRQSSKTGGVIPQEDNELGVRSREAEEEFNEFVKRPIEAKDPKPPRDLIENMRRAKAVFEEVETKLKDLDSRPDARQTGFMVRVITRPHVVE